MIGSLREQWDRIWPEVWTLIFDSSDVPADIYGELYRAAADHMEVRPSIQHQALVSSDPEAAYVALRSLGVNELTTETSVVRFMESAYDAIDELEIDGLPELYFETVASFIARYNLRYKLASPFELSVRLPWLFADVYDHLSELNQSEPHLRHLMDDFERTFSSFARTGIHKDYQTSTAKASNYAEGLAAFALQRRGGHWDG